MDIKNKVKRKMRGVKIIDVDPRGRYVRKYGEAVRFYACVTTAMTAHRKASSKMIAGGRTPEEATAKAERYFERRLARKTDDDWIRIGG